MGRTNYLRLRLSAALLTAFLLLMGGGKALATNYYLIGDFNSWKLSDANCQFSETTTSGVYQLKYSRTLTSGFKINDGSWNGSVDIGSNPNDQKKLVVGTAFNYTNSSSSKNITMDASVESPTLTLNTNDGTLLVSDGKTGFEKQLYLVGTFASKDEGVWATTKYKFYDTDEEGVYKCSFNGEFLSTYEFKVFNGTDANVRPASVSSTDGVCVGGSQDNYTMTKGTAFTYNNSTSSYSLHLSETITNPVFTIDVNKGTLTVEEGDVVYNIHCNFYDSAWKVGYKMMPDPQDANKWVVTLVPTNENPSTTDPDNYEFGVQLLIGGVQPGNSGWISATATAIINGDAVGVKVTEGENIKLAKNGALNETLTFTYDKSANTVNITKLVESTFFYPLPTTDKNYYTLYLSFDAKVAEGVQLYEGNINSDQTQFVAQSVTENEFTTDSTSYYIPAYTAVLVKRNPTKYDEGNKKIFYFFNKVSSDKCESIVSVEGNDLQGVLEDTKATSLAGEGQATLCIGIGEKTKTVDFRRPRNNLIYANDAYIVVNMPSDISGAKVVSIVFDDETTNINETASKIENKDTRSFNIAGQQVGKDYKGLVIRNGKKYVNK